MDKIRQKDIVFKEKSELEQRYNTVLHKYDKAVKECNELKTSLTKVQHQRDEYIKEINQVITARLKATQDLSRMTEERNSAVQEYNLIMSERDTVHKEIEKLQEELSENQKKLSTLQEEKKVNLEQIDSLKREITSVLIDRDRLSKKIQEYRARFGDYEENDSVSPLRSPTSPSGANNNGSHNNNHHHNQWDSSSSGISSSWKQNSMASIGSHGQSHLGSARLDSMEQVNMEIELLRRQNERLQQELIYSHDEIEMLKKERNIALEVKEKIVLERESMRTLCDRLRRERDLVVCDLAEALRDSDDMRRQLSETQKELAELKEKLESEKSCGTMFHEQSCSSISSILSSPTHVGEQQQHQQQHHHPTSPTPTLLDRAYNKIYGERRSRKTIDVSPEQEARETLASLDKVLADYSNQIKLTKKAFEKSKKEKEKNGGTWPKYRGPQILKMSEEEKILNGGPTMRSINRRGRKSLAVFNPINKANNNSNSNNSNNSNTSNNDYIKNHLPKGAMPSNETQNRSTILSHNESSEFPIYDKVNVDPLLVPSAPLNDYHSHSSSRSTPSNSSTPIPISNTSSNTLELHSSINLHNTEPINRLENYISPRESTYYRSRSKADSIDYSVVSAQIHHQDKKLDGSYRKTTNNSVKMRPHSIHDALTDAFKRTTLSSPSSTITLSSSVSSDHYHHPSSSFHSTQSHHPIYETFGLPAPTPKSSIPIPPMRTPGDSIGLFRVAQPLNKRTLFANHVHPSSASLPSTSSSSQHQHHHHSPNNISSLARPHQPSSSHLTSQPPPRRLTNSPHSFVYPYILRTNESGMNEPNLYDLPTSSSPASSSRPVSLYQPSLSKLTVKEVSHQEKNRYSNASPTLSLSGCPLGSDYHSVGGMAIGLPKSLSSQSSHFIQASLHIPQTSMDAGHGYKSDENESDLVSSYDGLSTFPKRSARIRIPSNPSVTSICSSGKLSTGSIDKVSSSAHSDRGSPLSFNVEWLSSGRRHRNTKSLKPRPGDIRHIEIVKSSGTLGINISSGPAGVFVTTVEKDSLAYQAGIQIGDQILEICGINMRNAVYDHAANILRQCGERLNLLVQYNPNKLKIPEQSAHDEKDENETQEDLDGSIRR